MKYLEEEKSREAGDIWIKNPYDLPDNKYATLTKLISTEKCLLKGEKYAHRNKIKIGDMISQGVARKVIPRELSECIGPVHFIAHHAMLKPTACRIDVNSSANFHDHVLNEYFAKDPDIMNKLYGVLFRFKEE